MPRPDEGLIHAWLDGQLPADEAARIEQLVATDPEWAAAVAEARGLVAASSRILSALDHVPAGVIPKGASSRAPRRLPWWTKAAAAVVLVVGGSVVVMQRAPVPMIASAPETTAETPPPVAAVPGAVTSAPVAVTPTPTPVPSRAPATSEAQARPAERVSTSREGKQVAGLAKTAVIGESDARRNTIVAAPPPPLMVTAPSIDAQLARARADSTRSAEGDAATRARDVRQLAGASDRAAAEAGMARAFAARTAEKATPNAPVTALAASAAASQARRVSGVVGGAPPASPVRPGACLRVQSDSETANAGIVMRIVRTDGDTLRLESAQGISALRAWVVWRDGVGRGAMVVAADGRGAVAVMATPVACPAP